MHRKMMIAMVGVLVCSLLVVGVALAMDSTNYSLDWFTPGTGGGGGLSKSSNYAVNFTVGQTALGSMSSTNYRGCLGYWCGAITTSVFLPIILR